MNSLPIKLLYLFNKMNSFIIFLVTCETYTEEIQNIFKDVLI